MNSQIAQDVAKAAPTIAVATSGAMGVDWSTVTNMLTAVYTAMLIVHHVITKWYIPWRDRRAGK